MGSYGKTDRKLDVPAGMTVPDLVGVGGVTTVTAAAGELIRYAGRSARRVQPTTSRASRSAPPPRWMPCQCE
jgi:hypothetical protein